MPIRQCKFDGIVRLKSYRDSLNTTTTTTTTPHVLPSVPCLTVPPDDVSQPADPRLGGGRGGGGGGGEPRKAEAGLG
ncbi:hypothetical protein E2C01_079224 [Portunus trituberculatus]|uniref:Uncharacterized protein n=1 Tax=Portunus trituberculatus TaxID=210409 RepID=A0A5B7IPR3_PORTR|nr:hypothetical protein [Portunus trituberculatus]